MAFSKKVIIPFCISFLTFFSLLFAVIGGGGILDYIEKIKKNHALKTNIIETIIIDPGHGGKDNGATAVYEINGNPVTFYEKDITLKLAIKLKNKLNKKYSHSKVKLTRTDDIYLSLEDRTNISNNHKQDDNNKIIIYISIHANYSKDETKRGYEIWYMDNDGNIKNFITDKINKSNDDILNEIYKESLNNTIRAKTEALANLIDNELKINIDRYNQVSGLRGEEQWALRKNKNISILIDTGFLSNRYEAFYLMNDNYQDKIVDGIVSGIGNFERYLKEKKNSFDEKTYLCISIVFIYSLHFGDNQFIKSIA